MLHVWHQSNRCVSCSRLNKKIKLICSMAHIHNSYHIHYLLNFVNLWFIIDFFTFLRERLMSNKIGEIDTGWQKSTFGLIALIFSVHSYTYSMILCFCLPSTIWGSSSQKWRMISSPQLICDSYLWFLIATTFRQSMRLPIDKCVSDDPINCRLLGLINSCQLIWWTIAHGVW